MYEQGEIYNKIKFTTKIKCEKVANRNQSRRYNNCTENFNRGVQQIQLLEQ